MAIALSVRGVLDRACLTACAIGAAIHRQTLRPTYRRCSCCPFGWPIRNIEQPGRAALAAHRNQSRFVRLGNTQPPWFCNRLMRSFLIPLDFLGFLGARNRILAECERPVSDRGHTPREAEEDQGSGKRRLALMLSARAGAAIHTRHQRRL